MARWSPRRTAGEHFVRAIFITSLAISPLVLLYCGLVVRSVKGWSVVAGLGGAIVASGALVIRVQRHRADHVRKTEGRICPHCQYELTGATAEIVRCPECSHMINIPFAAELWHRSLPPGS